MDVELTYRKWLEKVAEKLQFIHLKIKEKTELTEADYELMRVLYSKIWRPGEFAIFTHENITIKPDEVGIQQGLFDTQTAKSNDNATDSMTLTATGTKLEYVLTETKTEKK